MRNFVMFKKFVFVAVSMLMAANSVMANDDITSMLANLDGAKDKSAQVEDADVLGQKDVDALLGEDKNDSEEAVAACFRRFSHGGGYGSYNNHSCYNSYNSYNSYSYCSPYTYNYNYCYTPTYTCYTPVTYSCYTPCYTSYWGCW